MSAATTDGVAAHAGPARRAGRPGTGAARPRVAGRACGVAVTSAWARPRGARVGTGLVPGPVRNCRVSLAWPRLPVAAEVAIVAAGYAGYALVRLAVRADSCWMPPAAWPSPPWACSPPAPPRGRMSSGPGRAAPCRRLARRWAWAVTGAAARSRKRCYQVPVEAVGLGDGGPCGDEVGARVAAGAAVAGLPVAGHDRGGGEDLRTRRSRPARPRPWGVAPGLRVRSRDLLLKSGIGSGCRGRCH